MKIFIVLYIAVVGAPDGKVFHFNKVVPSYVHCLQMKDTPKDERFNMIHEECKIVTHEVPDVLVQKGLQEQILSSKVGT